LPSSRNGRRIIEDDDEEEAQLSIESEDSAEDSDEDEIAAVFEQVISACDSLSGRVRSLLEQRNIKNERVCFGCFFRDWSSGHCKAYSVMAGPVSL
jgi:hypothetical protein